MYGCPTVDMAHSIEMFNKHVNPKKYQRLEKMENAKQFIRVRPQNTEALVLGSQEDLS